MAGKARDQHIRGLVSTASGCADRMIGGGYGGDGHVQYSRAVTL